MSECQLAIKYHDKNRLIIVTLFITKEALIS